MLFRNSLIIFIIVFISTTAFANSLDKIIVTANRADESTREITVATTIVTEENLAQTSAENVAELFDELNVGHIHKYPTGLSTISLRGISSDVHGDMHKSGILVLIDGRLAGTINLNKILTKNVERIEIVKGPSSVQYGANAMGGVVNIITKKGRLNPNIFIESSIGSFGQTEITVGSSGMINNIDYSFSISKAKSDDYHTPKGTYDNTDQDNTNVNINLGYIFLKSHHLGFKYQQFQSSDTGMPGEYDIQTIAKKSSQDTSLKSFDLSYEGKATHLSWKTRYYQGQDERKLEDHLWSNKPEYTTSFSGAQANVTYKRKFVTITTGVDYSTYEKENRVYDFDGNATTPFSPDSEYTNKALYVLPKLTFMKNKLIINAGVRHDIFEVKINDTPLWTDLIPDDDENSNTLYSASIAYHLNDYIKCRAGYGEGYKVPAANELVADYSFWMTPYLGNPNLSPENSHSREIGLDIEHPLVTASATYFNTTYRNKIERTFEVDHYTWKNIDKSRIDGIEGEISTDLGYFFDLEWIIKPYLGVTYFTRFKDYETDENMKNFSRVQGNSGILISHTDNGFFTKLNIAYTGEQKQDYFSPLDFSTTVQKIDSFTVANWVISQRVFKSKTYGNFTLFGNIDNLFNETYEYVIGYPMPERNYKVSAKYNYQF